MTATTDMTAATAGPLPALADALASTGYALERAVPRDHGHLLLAVGTDPGTEVAGQWFAADGRAAHVARATAAVVPDDDEPSGGGVRTVGDHVVLQAAGADRRLPELYRLAARPGATLVAHRPERRGVVRHEPGPGTERTFTKVVRPGRTDAAVAALAAVGASTGVRVPRVVRSDTATMTMTALPGRTLHELLGDARLGPGALYRAGLAVGATVRHLHSAVIDVGGPPAAGHDAAAELAVTERWVGLAARFGALPLADREVTAAVDRVRARLTPCARPVLLHRDLHDKQLLLDGDDVGVLDLDLCAVGDPALDLANLLVHLELRARQGHVGTDGARACAAGVLTGYRPSAAVRRSLPGYALATRVRLLAVYAFRPRSTDAARRVLTEPLEHS